MDFLETFTSGRYHRDVKIEVVSKWFRVYDIFKKLQIDDDGGGGQMEHFLR